MNVFVLHPITKSYRTKNGAWSPRAESAVGFETSQEAVEYCDEFVNDVSQVILEQDFSHNRATFNLRKNLVYDENRTSGDLSLMPEQDTAYIGQSWPAVNRPALKKVV